MKKLLFALLAVAVSPPLFAQVSGTITSSQLVCIGVSAEHSTVGVQVTGTWTGTLQPQVAIQGQALTNSQVVPSTSTTPASTITANGVYYANVGSASQFCILGNTVASGSAVVFLNAAKGVNASTLGGGGAGSGTVTNSGNLVLNNLLLGAGATSVKDYGSSVLAPANGGVAALNTADQGYVIPTFLANFTLSPTSSSLVGAANQLRVVQFVLPHSVTVRRITWITVASPGDTVAFGIYSADGTTKLVDSGAVVSAGAAAAQQVSITAVVLPPGPYFLAFTQTGTPSTTFTCLAQVSLGGVTLGTILNNDAVKKMGTAANSATAGALPASLGAITASSAFSVPFIFFEP